MQFNFLIENISSMQDWDESLKLKFLSLAAQFDPEKTISIIANDRFPLDQAMDICRRASNLQGIAFIHFRNGAYPEFFELLMEVPSLDRRSTAKPCATARPSSPSRRSET